MDGRTAESSTARILLIDDEPAILRTFRYCLEDAGHRVSTARDSAQALAALQSAVFDICFLDLRLGEADGLELLPQLLATAPWMQVVVATAHSSINSAVAAMQAGASDYLVKPCSPEQLRLAVSRAVAAQRLQLRVESFEREQRQASALLESRSSRMSRVIAQARQVADTDASVLILGESGTGKGVLARAIHEWSPRHRAALVTISCPSLSAELLESELFGHVRGAFTGASQSTQGRVAQAEGGTLFLDEIGDFPLPLQPKLLRFVQDKEYERVGDAGTRTADVRIIAATNRDLAAMVRSGEFRQDLLYRLNVITLELPPLRECPEDIPGIAERCLVEFAKSYRRPARHFSAAAEAALRGYAWPGNVRELRNVIERAVILCPVETIDVGHLSISAESGPPPLRLGDRVSLEAIERAHICAVLANSSTLEAAARTLGIDTSTLYRKRRQYGL